MQIRFVHSPDPSFPDFQLSGVSTVSGALTVRYLAGILEMPTFWIENGPIHVAISTKILGRLILTLKDLGLDPVKESATEFYFDADGVDSLALSVLTGVLGWSTQTPKTQYWYRDLTEVVQFLRRYVLILQ